MLLKRRENIIKYLKEKGSASLEELIESFQVSSNTIRRDLNFLESQGMLKKVYGGVVLVEQEAKPIGLREIEAAEEKDKIGRVAAELVKDQDIIIVDAGSTTAQMVKYLENKKKVTLITNSVNILNEALQFPNFELILTGGNLLRETHSLVGPNAINNMRGLNANTAFIGATGISIQKGLTNASIMEAEIKKAMISSADKLVLMLDSTKFDLISLVSFADLKEVDVIITDEEVGEEYRRFFEEHNIELIVVK